MNSFPDSTAAFTGAQKPAENVSILDFCDDTEVTTGVLIPVGDKKTSKPLFTYCQVLIYLKTVILRNASLYIM